MTTRYSVHLIITYEMDKAEQLCDVIGLLKSDCYDPPKSLILPPSIVEENMLVSITGIRFSSL